MQEHCGPDKLIVRQASQFKTPAAISAKESQVGGMADRLPAHLFAVLVAYYLHGLTERETAARLNLTRHQVRTRHARALAILLGELNVRES